MGVPDFGSPPGSGKMFWCCEPAAAPSRNPVIFALLAHYDARSFPASLSAVLGEVPIVNLLSVLERAGNSPRALKQGLAKFSIVLGFVEGNPSTCPYCCLALEPGVIRDVVANSCTAIRVQDVLDGSTFTTKYPS